MAGKLGQHAVVVGASIAGLVAARVLAEHFDRVTAIEQDELSDRPAIHKSVPQGHHLHAMLPGGIKVMSSLYPAFTGELMRRGATRVSLGRDVVWYLPDGKAYNPTGSIRAPFDSGLVGYCASRGLIEFVIRSQTTAIDNIRLLSATAVRELIFSQDRVQGIRTAEGRTLDADLVIDATGRGRRARQWLTGGGFPPPEETSIGLDTAYSTANFRRPPSFAEEPIIFITGPAPGFTRRGYVITIENGTLLVSLIGRFRRLPANRQAGLPRFRRRASLGSGVSHHQRRRAALPDRPPSLRKQRATPLRAHDYVSQRLPGDGRRALHLQPDLCSRHECRRPAGGDPAPSAVAVRRWIRKPR
jgi:2-polyprenyl-6-methoxyphenol hydroxylase-like FAD-dependent oxidoreductase